MSCLRPIDTSALLLETLDALEISKQRHEALVRKYRRTIDLTTHEARRVQQLTNGEPGADTKTQVIFLLRKRAILRASVHRLQVRIASLFERELVLEQSALLAQHIHVIKGSVRVLESTAPTVNDAQELSSTLHELTARVCEVSDLIAETDNHEDTVDDATLERELSELCDASLEASATPSPSTSSVPSTTPSIPSAPSNALERPTAARDRFSVAQT